VIGVAVQIATSLDRVESAIKKSRARNLKRAAFLIYEDSVASIQEADGPSQPGTPPHTHTQGVVKRGKNKGKKRLGQLPRAINYAADPDEAVIGPRESVVALAGAAHEKGEDFHGDHFEKRPYMVPALERQAPAFGESFHNSLGS
jgi:hypothetical protein